MNRTAECRHARVHGRKGLNGRTSPVVYCEYGFIKDAILSEVMRLKNGKQRCTKCVAWEPAEYPARNIGGEGGEADSERTTLSGI